MMKRLVLPHSQYEADRHPYICPIHFLLMSCSCSIHLLFIYDSSAALQLLFIWSLFTIHIYSSTQAQGGNYAVWWDVAKGGLIVGMPGRKGALSKLSSWEAAVARCPIGCKGPRRHIPQRSGSRVTARHFPSAQCWLNAKAKVDNRGS